MTGMGGRGRSVSDGDWTSMNANDIAAQELRDDRLEDPGEQEQPKPSPQGSPVLPIVRKKAQERVHYTRAS
jgi:hypothetical protein